MTHERPREYDRRAARFGWLKNGDSLKLRAASRLAGLLFLGLVIGDGLIRGGYLDYEDSAWLKLPGRVASVAGMAASDIKIQGLTHHEPETLLAAIGVTPGGSMVGFDAAVAKRILENLDWVAAAKVQLLFPNQLEIAIAEREPFAIWQREGTYYVIDRTGAAMSGIPASEMVKLPLITGNDANLAAEELINQLEAYPDLMLQVKAASRVGSRRWNLYLDNGVSVLLPEAGWQTALAAVAKLDRTQQLLSKGIRSVDFRLAGQVTVAVAEIVEDKDGKAAKTR